jgi:hypothetical protein
MACLRTLVAELGRMTPLKTSLLDRVDPVFVCGVQGALDSPRPALVNIHLSQEQAKPMMRKQ